MDQAFGLLLSRYIDNIGEQVRWLPIVAFLYSILEGKSQVQFWIDREDPNTRQPMQRQQWKLSFAVYRRRLFLCLLLSVLSGALFFALLFGC